jgi:putative hydrolase of the HAD superfamily
VQPRIRAVSFDLFDTLVDLHLEQLPPVRVEGDLVSPTAPALYALLGEGAPLSFAAFARTLRDVDRAVRRRQHQQGREVSTHDRFTALAEALGVAPDPVVERMRREHMGRLKGQVRPLPHHPELLRALRARVALGVCSNFTDTETALAVLDEADLRGSLDAVAISERVGWRKPRREIFEALLAELDLEPAEVLHVGDNLDADVGGASVAGLRTAWLTRRVADPAEARHRHAGPLPEFTLADLAELPALLERIG